MLEIGPARKRTPYEGRIVLLSQRLTAIAKLAPQALIAPGLSVHYSGGSSLAGDVRAWLTSQ